MADRIRPHVTVLYEFVDVDRLRQVTHATAPLRLHLTRVRRWEQEPGIYLDVTDAHGDLERFRAAALGAVTEGYHPHVTILHRDSIASAAHADDAWTALGDTVFATDIEVAELVVYDQLRTDAAPEEWKESVRLRLSG